MELLKLRCFFCGSVYMQLLSTQVLHIAILVDFFHVADLKCRPRAPHAGANAWLWYA